MDKVFENNIIKIKHDTEKSLLLVDWSEQCGNLLSEDYDNELKKIHVAAQINGCKYLLVNMNECRYIETDQHHRWFENTIFSKYSDIGARKIAFVVPDNLFAQVSFEANQMSLKETDTQIQYFKDVDKARLWLDAD
jgi:hypothetical protein